MTSSPPERVRASSSQASISHLCSVGSVIEFACEMGVTLRGVGVTLDRISTLIKSKREQEDSAQEESAEQKVRYGSPGMACLG